MTTALALAMSALVTPTAQSAASPESEAAPSAKIERFTASFCDAYRALRVVTRVTNTSGRTIVVGYFGDGMWPEDPRSALIKMEPGSTLRITAHLAHGDSRLELWQVAKVWDPEKIRLLDSRKRPGSIDCSSMDFRSSYGPQEPESCTLVQTLDNSRSTGPVIFRGNGGKQRLEGGELAHMTVPLTVSVGLGDFDPPMTYLSWSLRSAGAGSLSDHQEVPLTCAEPLPSDMLAGAAFDLGADRVFEATVVVPALGRPCPAGPGERRPPRYRLQLRTSGDPSVDQGDATVSAWCEEGSAVYRVEAETWFEYEWNDVAVGDVLHVQLDNNGVVVTNVTSGEQTEALEEIHPALGQILHWRPRRSSVVDHAVTDVLVGGQPAAEFDHRLFRAIRTHWSVPLDVELVDDDTMRFAWSGAGEHG